MADDLDKASTIWSGLLTPGQLLSLGIKEEAENKPNKRQRKKDRGSSTTASRSDSSDNTAAMVKVMAKILLRHEDTIHVLLQEMEFVLFLKPGEGSLLPILMACHKEWQEGPRTHTLRHTMALTMISTLK